MSSEMYRSFKGACGAQPPWSGFRQQILLSHDFKLWLSCECLIFIVGVTPFSEFRRRGIAKN
jgi:hypothetical protein